MLQHPASPQDTSQGWGQIDLTLKYFPLAWVLEFFKPVVSVNGHTAHSAWRRHVVDMPAGHHVLEVWYPYMLWERSGYTRLEIDVYPGHATRLMYTSPFFVFMSGTFTLFGSYPIAPPALPPGGHGHGHGQGYAPGHGQGYAPGHGQGHGQGW